MTRTYKLVFALFIATFCITLPTTADAHEHGHVHYHPHDHEEEEDVIMKRKKGKYLQLFFDTEFLPSLWSGGATDWVDAMPITAEFQFGWCTEKWCHAPALQLGFVRMTAERTITQAIPPETPEDEPTTESTKEDLDDTYLYSSFGYNVFWQPFESLPSLAFDGALRFPVTGKGIGIKMDIGASWLPKWRGESFLLGGGFTTGYLNTDVGPVETKMIFFGPYIRIGWEAWSKYSFRLPPEEPPDDD